MRFITCTMWVLVGMLALAALDTTPDPPAVSPRTVASQVPQTVLDSSVPAEFPSTSLVSPDLPPALAQVGEPRDANCPHDLIVLTGQAGDPSPPAAQA